MNTKTIRILQWFIITAVALYATLVFAGNLMDYNANYEFVKHVLAMDTTFKDQDIMWRAITNTTVVNLAYWGIIATEGAIGLLGWIASVKLFRRFKKPAQQFEQAKTAGFYAFVLALLLWFVGFICFGSEWFAMWQSSTWSGKTTAMEISTVMGIFLIIYMVPLHLFTQGSDKKLKE